MKTTKLDINNKLVQKINLNKDLNLHLGKMFNPSSARRIFFTAKGLESLPQKGTGSMTTESNQLLIFEIDNKDDDLRLFLKIQSGDNEVRKQILEKAKSASFFNAKVSTLSEKSTTIFSYKLGGFELSSAELVENFDKFLDNEFKEIIKTYT